MAVKVAPTAPNSVSIADTAGRDTSVTSRAAFVAFDLSDSAQSQVSFDLVYGEERQPRLLTCRCGSRTSLWIYLCDDCCESPWCRAWRTLNAEAGFRGESYMLIWAMHESIDSLDRNICYLIGWLAKKWASPTP